MNNQMNLTAQQALDALNRAWMNGTFYKIYEDIQAIEPHRILDPDRDLNILRNCLNGTPDGNGEPDAARAQRFVDWWAQNSITRCKGMAAGDVMIECARRGMRK